MFKILNKNQGNTIVETLIAVGVISVGLIGVISLVVGAVSASSKSKNVIVANNLAREGIEVVRSLRDSNWLNKGVAYDDGILPPDLNDNGSVYCRNLFEPDLNQWSLEKFAEGAAPKDLFDDKYQLYFSDSDYYHYDGIENNQTEYWRVIIITKNSSSEFKIVSKVGWYEDGKQKQVDLEDVLTNWYVE